MSYKKNFPNISLVLSICIFALLFISLSACGSPSTELEAPTQIPTDTLTPIITQPGTPTATITPTHTITYTPTVTLTPTITRTPTITLPASNGISCIPKDNDRVEARVVQITDGDTIVVEIDGEEFKYVTLVLMHLKITWGQNLLSTTGNL